MNAPVPILGDRVEALLARKEGCLALLLHIANCEHDVARAVRLRQQLYVPLVEQIVRAVPESS
jgi:hypothetical protein